MKKLNHTIMTFIQDGKALGALVDACSWATIADWNDDTPALDKNTRAVILAQEKLDIPGIMPPKDIGKDDLSLVCYLNYFFVLNAKKKILARPVGGTYGKLLFQGTFQKGQAPYIAPATAPAGEKDWQKIRRERSGKFHNITVAWQLKTTAVEL